MAKLFPTSAARLASLPRNDAYNDKPIFKMPDLEKRHSMNCSPTGPQFGG